VTFQSEIGALETVAQRVIARLAPANRRCLNGSELSVIAGSKRIGDHEGFSIGLNRSAGGATGDCTTLNGALEP
jgi:hypothetical protein